MQQKIHSTLQDIMDKDMDRKDFLKHVGVGFAAIVGVTTAIKTMTQFSTQTQFGSTQTAQRGASTSSYGYGASAYGGGHSNR